ncbi:hypothetical protein [Liquorilactobacillus satsumensis]|uniref:Uncharacterized protein n=1 Tax=Liquorilactobacillus satsumensis DSM 16230 = JCM 12392 TaxID=1423801 RepID=A0A0R1UW40_9LACO|nr:hypothetical protein [Liquorilactobacillus satsumensis]KRL97455.1 hypothetical protein FD50_GL001436 [Liquorilactobacillus satsumensis DSM 16230 = JCM 12392]
MVESNAFTDKYGKQILVVGNRANIELASTENTERIIFDLEMSIDILQFIYKVAKRTWKNFTPKEALSDSSDYYTYYDKRLDSEGGLYFVSNNQKEKSLKLIVERPYGAGKAYYKFNKVRCETFIYDVIKRFPEIAGVKE